MTICVGTFKHLLQVKYPAIALIFLFRNNFFFVLHLNLHVYVRFAVSVTTLRFTQTKCEIFDCL